MGSLTMEYVYEPTPSMISFHHGSDRTIRSSSVTPSTHDAERHSLLSRETYHESSDSVISYIHLRKQYQLEIEQLNMRLADAEAKLKTEVARIKKKMQVQITELEMSLDVANRQNMDLQKTIKKQSLQISELQSHYDEIHRQLQQAVDSLGASQRRNQALQAELDEVRVALEQTLRGKRTAEMQLEEAGTRINELNTVNINLTSAKSKIESEYQALQSDYDEIHKELRVCLFLTTISYLTDPILFATTDR